MTRWPTEKHFTAWLTLVPQGAMNLGRTRTALGAFYRRVDFRIGKAKAITATACMMGRPPSPRRDRFRVLV